MGLFSWRQWFSRRVRASRRSTAARNNNTRLQLEQLEARLAPTTDLWTGGDAGINNKWSDAKNWSTGTPTTGMDLVFQAGVTGKGLTSVNDLTSGTTFNSITLAGTGYTLSGNSLTINNTTGGNSLIADASTNNTIALDVQLGSFGGGNATIDVQPSATLTITGQLSTAIGATAQLNKSDNGTLVLSGDDSTFNGNIAVEQGVLQITTPTALGNPNGGHITTVAFNAQLQLNNVDGTVKENLILSGGYTDTTGALLNVAGTTTWSSLSTITLAANTTIGVTPGTSAAPSSLTIAGLITDNSEGFNLTKEGGGQLILSHANTYRGQTIINNGILTIQNNQALGDPNAPGGGTASSDTVVNSNPSESGTLQIDGSNGAINVQNEILVLNGPGFNPGTGVRGAVENLVGNNTWNGNVILGSPSPNGSNVSMGSEASTVGTTTTVSDLLITGIISDPQGGGPFNLTKIGAGRITLEPLASGGNTYRGSTTVQNGYLRVEDSQALGPNGKFSGTTVDNGAELELYADPTHKDSVTGTTTKGELHVQQSLTLFGLGISEQGALHSIQGINSWSNGIDLGGTAGIGVDPDPNESSTNAYLTNDFSLTVPSLFGGNLVKLGTGQLILPNSNNYQNTDIQQGWITAENSNSLGAFRTNVGLTQQYTVTVEYGAALHLLGPSGGGLNLPQEFILAGDGISHPFKQDGVNTFGINQDGAVESLEGNNTLSGIINLENNAGIGVEQIFTDSKGNLLPSKLTLTGQLEDYVPTTFSYFQSGNGPAEQDFSYNTGAISGTLTVNYNFFGATPDDLQVLYSGTLLKDTTPTTGAGSFTIPYGPGAGNVPPPSTTVQVVVNQGGAGIGANWNYSVTFRPTLVGGGLDKLGSQELVIQGPGTYTGNVDVRHGVLLDQNDTALGAPGAGGVTVEDGAALLLDNVTALQNGGQVTGIQVLNKALTLNGAGNSYFLTSGPANPLDKSTVYSDGNPATSSSSASPPTTFAPLTALTSSAGASDYYWSGPITLGSSSVIDVEPNARLALAGAIDDGSTLATPPPAADLTKIGIGELTLAGASTYRGTAWINQGILTVANGQALGAIPAAGATTPAGWPAGAIPGGTVVANGASLQLEGNVSVAGEPLAILGTGPATTPTVGETWFPLGPAAINSDSLVPGTQVASGRVTAVVADPSDANVIYVGTAGGGIWRTQDGGKTWHQLFDALSLSNPLQVPMNIGTIVIDPGQPQTLYVGTGEADTGNTLQGTGVSQRDTYPGTGVYVSHNSGVTWTLLTNTDGTDPIAGDDVTSILLDPNTVDPTGHTILYVATSNMNDPSAPQGAVYRYDSVEGYVNLVNQVDSIRASVKGVNLAAPNSPGPDDDYRIRFPDSPSDGPQEWSSLALGHEILTDAGGNVTYQGPVLYAALGTPAGNPSITTFEDQQHPFPGNFTEIGGAIPPEGLIFNAVYHTDNFDPYAFPPYRTLPPNQFVIPPDSSYTTPNWLIGWDKPPSSGAQTYDQENTNEFPTSDGASSTNVLPTSGVIKLAYAPNVGSQGTIYASVALGLYNSDGRTENAAAGNIFEFEQSTDGGKTWSAVTLPTNYLNGLFSATGSPYADAITTTSNASAIYVGGATPTNYLQAFTGSWTNISTGSNGNGPFDGIHVLSLDNQGRVLAGTDGGLFRYDPTKNIWTDLNGNLAISLTGSVAVAPSALNVAIASTHETGTAIDTGNQPWTYVTPGDFSVQIDPITPNVYYGVDNSGGFGTLLESTQSGAPGTWSAFPGAPPFIRDLAPINPNDHNRLVVADAFGIYEYANGKWTNLGGSGTLVAPATYQGTYLPDNSFGDAPNIGSDGYAKSTIYAANGGQVEVTEDHGAKWVGRNNGLSGATITGLIVDPRTSSTAFAVTSAGQVFRTTDFGRNWTSITGTGLPQAPVSGLPAIANHSIVIDPRNGDVYVGTEEGVYVATSLNGASTQWTRFGIGMPLARVTDLVLNETTDTLTASTYGRSVFQLTLDDATANDGALRSVSGTNVWAGPITLDGNTTIGTDGTQVIQDGFSAATLEISGPISDNGGAFNLTKIGQGTLKLAAANTYTGQTDIQSGLVIVLNSQALGTSAAAGTTVENGAVLEMQSNINGAHLFLNGDGILVNDHNTGALWDSSGQYTYSGPITLQSNSTIGVDAGATLTIANANTAQTSIDDGTGNSFNLTKEGAGILVFAGTNTYHGNTNVNQGVLQITNGAALGGTPGTTATTVTDGAQLELEAPTDSTPFTVSNETLVLGGTGIFGSGALLDDRGSNTWAGPITLTSLANPTGFPSTQPIHSVNIGVTNAADTLTVSGVIGEQSGSTGIVSFGINKVGAGELVLQGSDTFTNDSTVTAGTLTLEDSQALGSSTLSSRTVTVASGAMLKLAANPSGKDSITGTANLDVSRQLILSGQGVAPGDNGALYNASGSNTWNGPVTMQANTSIGTAAASTLTIGGSINDNNSSTGLSQGFTLTKLGTGTLVLAAADTYTGQTLVTAGILEIENATSLGANGNGGTVVSDGASLELAGGITVSNSTLTLQGNGFNSSTGALDASGTDTWNNTVTLTGNSSLGAENNASLTVKGIISGSFGITKVGPGTVDLTADETYTDITTIDDGLLLVDGSIANGVSLNGGGLGGSGTINGDVTTTATGGTLAPGDGSSAGGILTVTGKVTLNAASTYFAYLVSSNSLTTTPPGYSQLSAGGNVTLGGATLAGLVGYSPALLTLFTPIQTTGSGTSVSGTFAQGGSAVLQNNLPFDITYNTTNVVLERDLATTITTLTDSTAPSDASVYGQPVVFTATVAPMPGYLENTPPENSGPPSGTVDFYLDGSATPIFSTTLTADSNNDGNSFAQYTYYSSALTPAPHTIYAKYEGDGGANYQPSTSATLKQTVTQATPTVTVTQTAPATTPVTGQPITLTATVAPPYTDPDKTLAGTVDFYQLEGTKQVDISGPLTIDSSGKASYTLSNGLTAAGSTYSFTVQFTDAATDGNFTNASGVLVETVNKDATTTTIASNPNQSTVDYGTATITASVAANGPGSGNPTGTVTFVAVSTDGKTTITDANEALNGSDVATMTKLLPVLAAGQSYTVTATYNGDANYITSSNSLTQTVVKATTTVTVSSSSASSVYGQKVTFTATVKPEDMGTPTGTAEFIVKDQNGNTVIDDTGIALNSSGVATDTTSATALTVSGSVYSVTVDYSGDSNFQSNSGTLAGGQTVSQATTSVAVTADNKPAVTGQKVTFTATVSPQYAGTPTGTAEFLVKDTNGTTVVDDKGIALNSSGVATDSTTALVASGSAYGVTVTYSGDGNFTGSSGTLTGGETVNKAGTTATVASSSLNPSTYGQAVTFTATVAVNTPGAGAPTGKVDFYSGSTLLGKGTLNGASTDTATYTTNPTTQLLGGSDTITAKYEGDTNFSASPSSAGFTQTVNTAPTTTGAVTYTSTPDNPPGVGDTITFSVTVSSTVSGIGAPTGTVNFLDNGSKVIGTGTVTSTSGSSATFQGNVSTLNAGNHSITAQYLSDGNFSSSTGGPAISLTVTKAQTTATLSPSSSGSEAYGQQAVTVKVTPNVSNTIVPTGNVTFTVKVGTTPFTTETDLLDSNGVATLKALLPAGQTYAITASYAGDNNYNSSSTASALSETVNPATSTTVVTGPSTTPVTGQPIAFTVTVSPQYNGVPQGTVNFYLGTSTTPLNSTPVTLDSTGAATFTYNPGLTADNSPYNIVAKFTDTDGNFNNSDNTAKPLSQAINKDDTKTSVTSGQPTSTYGQAVTFTATVSASAPGSGNPSGLVDFYSNGTLLGQGTLNGASTDQATYTTNPTTQLPGGIDKITAKYEGDNSYVTSTSTAINQTVNTVATTTGTVSISWTGSPTPPVSGQQITLSATVSGGSKAIGSPTGTVDFLDGSTLVGTGTLSDNGDGTSTASTTVTDLFAGSHSLTAKYLTDGNFATSKSATAASLTVAQANTTTAVQTSNANATYGQMPVTATVTANSPGSGTPTGQVVFTAVGGGNTYTDTETLDANGKATMTQLLPVLPAGQSYTITATYNGDSNYKASPASKSITQNYSTATDQVTVVSNMDPSLSGQAVTFTATITPQYAGLPNGSVVFTIDGSIPSDEPATGVAVSSGKAQYTTSSLSVGLHTVSASYTSSDANFSNNNGALAGGQTVNAAPPPPPPSPPSNSGGGNSQPAAPAFDFNHEFSLLETDAIYFAYYNGLAALGGYADPTLDAYVNYFLEQIYANPLLFTASGSYAISLGYDIGLFYFSLTQPTA